MTKIYVLLFSLMLSACGGSVDTRSTEVLAAATHTEAGVSAFSQAQWIKAELEFSRALVFYQGIDNLPGVLASHINLAEVALIVGDHLVVEEHLVAASVISNRIAAEEIKPRISLLYAQNALQQNQLALAKKNLTSLLPEFDALNPIGEVRHIQLIAIAARTKVAFAESRDTSLWVSRYATALRLSDTSDLGILARLLRFQAQLLQQQEYFSVAEGKLQQALGYYKDSTSRPGIAQTLSELAELHKQQNRWLNAAEYTQRAIAVFRYLGNIAKVAQLKKGLIEIEGHYDLAQQATE